MPRRIGAKSKVAKPDFRPRIEHKTQTIGYDQKQP